MLAVLLRWLGAPGRGGFLGGAPASAKETWSERLACKTDVRTSCITWETTDASWKKKYGQNVRERCQEECAWSLAHIPSFTDVPRYYRKWRKWTDGIQIASAQKRSHSCSFRNARLNNLRKKPGRLCWGTYLLCPQVGIHAGFPSERK